MNNVDTFELHLKNSEGVENILGCIRNLDMFDNIELIYVYPTYHTQFGVPSPERTIRFTVRSPYLKTLIEILYDTNLKSYVERELTNY